VTFDIPINVLVTGNTTTNLPTISTTQINTITFLTSGTSTITGPSTSPITTTTNPRNIPCNRVNVNTSAYTQTYQASITGSGFIVGTISQSLTTPSVSLEQNGCGLQASLKDIVTVINQQLNPTTCSYLNNLVQPLIVESTRTGVTSFS